MVIREEQQRLKSLLSETIILLCKNGLNFNTEISIEGLIGITLDQEDIFLVNIKESIVSMDQVDMEQIPRDVDSGSGRVNNEESIHKRARDIQTIPFHHDDNNITSVNPSEIKLKNEVLVVFESPTKEEAASSSTVASVKEEESIRPALRHDADYEDVNVATNIKNDFAAIPDHESSSIRPRKRRRLQQQSAATSTIHHDFPTARTANVSNSGGHYLHVPGNNKHNPANSQSVNIKVENNSELIEIMDDELSEREDTLKDGNDPYSQYDRVYGLKGGATDEDIGGEGYVLGGGSESVRSWQLLNPRADGCSLSQQETDIKCYPEEHLATCSYCGLQFNDMSDLRSHSCQLDVKTVFKRKKFKCFQKRKFDLSVSIGGSQPGERPFQCSICEKSFTTLFNCQRHELIHTGERPYECMLCHKRFAQLANLRVHDRIHCKYLPFPISSSV